MNQRTPVVAKLPARMLRRVQYQRTPVISGTQATPLSDLIERDDVTRGDVDASLALNEITATDDRLWVEAGDDLLRASLAYFFSEMIRGPEEWPYEGKSLVGKQHQSWDEAVQLHDRVLLEAARDHGKCAARGSLIQAADGRRVPIERWAGGEVVAFDQKVVGLRTAWASRAECQGVRPCVRVQTRTGRRETVTLNHRFFTVDGEVFAADLKVGMRIAVPRTLPVEGKDPLRPGEAWLLGLLIGDGCFRTSSVTLSAMAPMIVNEAGRVCSGMGWEIRPDKGGTAYRFNNGGQHRGSNASWARSLGRMGKKSDGKFVPDPLFTAPNTDVADFIAGLIDSNGNVNANAGGAVEVYSISKRLLRDVQHLLTRLGVVAVLARKNGRYKGAVHRSWRLTVRGAAILRLSAVVRLRSTKQAALDALAREQGEKDEGGSIDLLPKAVYAWLRHGKDWFLRRGGPKFRRRYDLTRNKARKLAKIEGNARLLQLADAEVLWDEVTSIEDAGEQETWAIHVPGFESYVGQDIINHNSHFFSLAYPIWQAGYVSPGQLGYIFSATQELASSLLQIVKDELLHNEKFAHLVPTTGDRLWSSKQITIRNGSRIRARGWGVRVRGGHPKWIVCDDCLSDNDIYSETIRRRSVDYFLSAITNMVIPGGQIIVVGSPMHWSDLYGYLRKIGTYFCQSYPAIDKAGRILFPERYDRERLEKKRMELGAARFAREFLCVPMTDEASLFPSTLFHAPGVMLPYSLGMPGEWWAERGMSRYTGVDFGLSTSAKADYTVIITLAVDDVGNRWIANIRRGQGWGFQQQLNEIKDEYSLMQFEVANVEANQAQRIFSDEIIATTGVPVRKFFTSGQTPKNPWHRGMTSMSENKNHIERGVPGLRLGIENRKWRVPRGDAQSIDLTDIWMGEFQAIGWQDGKVISVGDHDDMVMATWMADVAARAGGFTFSFGDAEVAVLRQEAMQARLTEPTQASIVKAEVPKQGIPTAEDIMFGYGFGGTGFGGEF